MEATNIGSAQYQYDDAGMGGNVADGTVKETDGDEAVSNPWSNKLIYLFLNEFFALIQQEKYKGFS